MDELIHDFGVLPDYIGLGDEHPTPARSEAGVRFRLEFWRAEGVYQLRHHLQKLDLPTDRAGQAIKLHFMRPAKGAGFCDLRIGDKNVDFPQLLLEGRHDDLRWLHATGEKLSQLTGFGFEEIDMGSDY